MTASENVLVIRAQRRRQDAFEQLMAIHERRLLSYLNRLVGNLEHAKDVSQDVWLAAWQSLPRLRDPDAFRAWLYRIAHRRSALYFRRFRRYESTAEAARGSDVNIAADPASGMHISDLHEAIAQLPSPQRDAILLHYIAGLSIAEIGVALACPPGTVKSRLHHARLQLKCLLEEETQHDT